VKYKFRTGLFFAFGIAHFGLGVLVADVHAADPAKILRVSSVNIGTLDPQQFSDDPSYQIHCAIFEGLYEWDYFASPARLAPNTAVAQPEISDDGRTWTIRIKPGIYFTDDPAFKGKRRELVASDYVYTIKRELDPNLAHGGHPVATDFLLGARAAVDPARKPGAKLDYDLPIEGLRAIERYTVQIRLSAPNYPLASDLVTMGAVAREVVEAAHGDIRTRAVGTGPYRVKEWRQGSRLVLEANPDYRALRFPESAPASVAALMQGKKLPQIGVVEVSFIDESIAAMLEFASGKLDYVQLRGQAAASMLADGKLKPEYAARGVTRDTYPLPYTGAIFFNVADPVLGGMSNEHVALRRAIGLALDVDSLVKVLYNGQASPTNQLLPPGVAGYDASVPGRSQYDPAAAQALLDRFGYGKRDAANFRVGPDGKPLTLAITLASAASAREFETLMKKNLDAIGLRLTAHVTPFQDAVKEVTAGRYQMYYGSQGGDPSGWIGLRVLYGKSPPWSNISHFSSPEYDRAADEFLRAGTAAEQVAAARTMSNVAHNYAPMFPVAIQTENDFVQPWLLGFSPPVFQTHWKYMDIDVERKRQGKR
jgi:ABC-type transport system substrate-binding protein